VRVIERWSRVVELMLAALLCMERQVRLPDLTLVFKPDLV